MGYVLKDWWANIWRLKILKTQLFVSYQWPSAVTISDPEKAPSDPSRGLAEWHGILLCHSCTAGNSIIEISIGMNVLGTIQMSLVRCARIICLTGTGTGWKTCFKKRKRQKKGENLGCPSKSPCFWFHLLMAFDCTRPWLARNSLVQTAWSKSCVYSKKSNVVSFYHGKLYRKRKKTWIWGCSISAIGSELFSKKIGSQRCQAGKHQCQSLGPRDKDQKPLEVPWAAVSSVSSRHVGYPIAKTPVLKCVRSIFCWTNNQQLGCQNCWVLECPGRRLVAWG